MDFLNGTYCGPPPEPFGIWSNWNLDPVLLMVLAAAALLLRRSMAGLMAVAVLVIAFVSPLCALSAALFSARVVHHVLIIAVAAPLLAMARPAARWPGAGLALVLLTSVLWLWHLPVAYDLALANKGVYWVMQASLLAAAVLFWQSALHEKAGGYGLLLVLGGYVQMGMLGALLTFAPSALYAAHAGTTLAWGLSDLGDQQLGGLIMWVPAGLPFLAFGAVVARRHWRLLAEQRA